MLTTLWPTLHFHIVSPASIVKGIVLSILDLGDPFVGDEPLFNSEQSLSELSEGRRNMLIHSLCLAALKAGEQIMTYFDQPLEVDWKSDDTPLTLADQAAHEVLTNALSQLSTDPILSEEGQLPPFNERSQWPRYWLIDPLDGTKEFIAGREGFTVNIALVCEGEAMLGIVYAPATKELFVGEHFSSSSYSLDSLGQGRRGKAYYARAASADNLQLKEIASCFDSDGVRVLSSRSHDVDKLQQFLPQLNIASVTPLGSSLKMCRIAQGIADVYVRVGPTSEWDTAAGQVVVEAAGGALHCLAGNSLRYNTKESILNDHFIVRGHGYVWDAQLQQLVVASTP